MKSEKWAIGRARNVKDYLSLTKELKANGFPQRGDGRILKFDNEDIYFPTDDEIGRKVEDEEGFQEFFEEHKEEYITVIYMKRWLELNKKK